MLNTSTNELIGDFKALSEAELDIEEDAVISEEVYDTRFTVSNDNARRVVYREVDVEMG